MDSGFKLTDNSLLPIIFEYPFLVIINKNFRHFLSP